MTDDDDTDDEARATTGPTPVRTLVARRLGPHPHHGAVALLTALALTGAGLLVYLLE